MDPLDTTEILNWHVFGRASQAKNGAVLKSVLNKCAATSLNETVTVTIGNSGANARQSITITESYVTTDWTPKLFSLKIFSQDYGSRQNTFHRLGRVIWKHNYVLIQSASAKQYQHHITTFKNSTKSEWRGLAFDMVMMEKLTYGWLVVEGIGNIGGGVSSGGIVLSVLVYGSAINWMNISYCKFGPNFKTRFSSIRQQITE